MLYVDKDEVPEPNEKKVEFNYLKVNVLLASTLLLLV